MLLGRLKTRGYLQKFQAMVGAEGEVFFLRYVSRVRSKIDGSDLICATCAPDMFP
jgi:hypothetical protein